MPGRPQSTAAPVVLIGAVALLSQLAGSQVVASPDGADWAAAENPEGCRSCHYGSFDDAEPDALSIEGLPSRPDAGSRYKLTVVLEDPALKNAGFLLSIESGGLPAGLLEASDDKTETNGASARSNWEGSFPPEPGRASWELIWTAPAVVEGPIRFSLWGNAGNDDLSPLGDRPHRRIWQLPATQ